MRQNNNSYRTNPALELSAAVPTHSDAPFSNHNQRDYTEEQRTESETTPGDVNGKKIISANKPKPTGRIQEKRPNQEAARRTRQSCWRTRQCAPGPDSSRVDELLAERREAARNEWGCVVPEVCLKNNTVALKSSSAHHYPSKLSFAALAISPSRFLPNLQPESKPSSHEWISYKAETRRTKNCTARKEAFR